MRMKLLGDGELFDLFVGGQATVEEIAQLDLGTLTRQIAELRRDEPDDITMTNAEIAAGIYRYVTRDTENREKK